MNKAVNTLHNDLQRYRKAESNEKSHATAETRANTASKTAAANEAKALAAIAAQKQAILDQFATNPPDPVTAQKLLGNMFALGEQAVQTKDAYSKKIGDDNTAAKKDAKAVGLDQKAIKADRKKALKDLQPAEYHMNLKDANRVRKELGLKAVKKPIRPPAATGSKTIDLAKKYLGRYETDLQRAGVTLPCPTNESCANFVSSMLVKSGASNFRTLGVSALSSGLQARGWRKVPLADAKPGDVWICLNARGAPREQHTELVATNRNGHVTLIGSNNHPVDSNQQINYDPSSASIQGSYILAPP
jgi:hypothetical protein